MGSPTRFGNSAEQLKAFLDTTGGLWAQGKLAGLVGTSFTSASTGHGGLEATILSMNNVLYHWGALVMPLGYAADAVADVVGQPVRRVLGVAEVRRARRRRPPGRADPGHPPRGGRREADRLTIRE